MGRIADALKKAQRERNEKLRLGLAQNSPAGAVAIDMPTPVADLDMSGGADRLGTQGLPIRPGATLWSSSRTPVAMDPMPDWNVDPAVVAVHDRTSSIVEQYRAIRTWLLSHTALGEHNCVAITSSVALEGKTVTTANLAVVLAEVRHMNVLVVDADFRRGSLAQQFRTENSPGLADVLAGKIQLSEAIAQTPISNLSFLPASKCFGLNPTELFNSKSASLVFDEIRERYHYVLVDTPPVQSFSDVGVIGALCTGIVMVVRMRKTASTLVRQSVQWLQANNLNVIGCIAAAARSKPTRLVYQYDKG
ncbi:MAG: CpsD/CapB family tyrosine-protein kinase [Planctomycetota bacterium]|nr:CpsD/CapB family tyrosine-protein kinase [Planctomycetota bacterium]